MAWWDYPLYPGQLQGSNLVELDIHCPEQTLADVTPYPWSIRADGELCQILDLTLTNPYQAIDLGSKWNELHLVRNVFACPLKTGVYVDQCPDTGRIENVHFNPNFWTRDSGRPRSWAAHSGCPRRSRTSRAPM